MRRVERTMVLKWFLSKEAEPQQLGKDAAAAPSLREAGPLAIAPQGKLLPSWDILHWVAKHSLCYVLYPQ